MLAFQAGTLGVDRSVPVGLTDITLRFELDTDADPEKQARLIETAERYRFMERCVVIGRGYNYATAFEISLKITELTRIIAESYSSADFMHGPIAMVDRTKRAGPGGYQILGGSARVNAG